MAYLPLTTNPEESFSITIFDNLYYMRQLWNTYSQFWTLDIADANHDSLVYGVRIVTQWYVLKQYPHIPFDLFSSNTSEPTRDNLDEFYLEVSEK